MVRIAPLANTVIDAASQIGERETAQQTGSGKPGQTGFNKQPTLHDDVYIYEKPPFIELEEYDPCVALILQDELDLLLAPLPLPTPRSQFLIELD